MAWQNFQVIFLWKNGFIAKMARSILGYGVREHRPNEPKTLNTLSVKVDHFFGADEVGSL